MSVSCTDFEYLQACIIACRLYVLQASLPELVVDESDSGPARLVLYSNLPITCQGVNTRTNSPLFCWVTFALSSNEDIAMRQRVPGTSTTTKHMCTYRLHEEDWKPAEQNAYGGNRSLDIVAKVRSLYASSYSVYCAITHASKNKFTSRSSCDVAMISRPNCPAFCHFFFPID